MAGNKGNFAAFQHRMGGFFILRPAFEQACANAGPFIGPVISCQRIGGPAWSNVLF
jgi:hypothetical protein